MLCVTCSRANMFLAALSSNTPRPVSSTAGRAGAVCRSHHRAPERFQDIARAPGLPAATPPEGVEALAAVERLRDAVGIEPSLRDLGVDERDFLDALPQQALNTDEDQCAAAGPRMPVPDGTQALMRTAHHG